MLSITHACHQTASQVAASLRVDVGMDDASDEADVRTFFCGPPCSAYMCLHASAHLIAVYKIGTATTQAAGVAEAARLGSQLACSTACAATTHDCHHAAACKPSRFAPLWHARTHAPHMHAHAHVRACACMWARMHSYTHALTDSHIQARHECEHGCTGRTHGRWFW